MGGNTDVNRLAQFIMEEIPGEPSSQHEGAVDCAMRLLRQAYATGLRVAGDEKEVRPRLITGDIPEIVVLCGSRKFMDVFKLEEERLELEGKIVLTISGAELDQEGEAKAMVDELHLRRIDLADNVHVIDVDGYVGLSTRAEVDYARRLEKNVTFLSDGEVEV